MSYICTMQNTTFIYCLIDPRDQAVRYIGKANDPLERYWNHFNKREHTHKRSWFDNLKKNNCKAILEILDEVPFDEWQFWETFYISLYKSWGFSLCNHTLGGGNNILEETKKKISNTLKGRKFSEEVRKNMSLGQLGKKQKPESIEKGNKLRRIKILQYDLNNNFIKEWNSIKEAQNLSGEHNISKILRGKSKSKKYIWKLAEGMKLKKSKYG